MNHSPARPIWAALLAALLLLSCSSSPTDENSGSPSGPTEGEIDELETITESAGSYQAAGAALAAEMDTAAALDSLASLIAADPEVDWATNCGTGVNIEWASGFRGIVVLRLRNGEGPEGGGGKTGRAPGGEERPAKGVAGEGITIPSGRNTLFLAPTWSEFENEDQEFVDSASKYLPMRGYAEPVVWKDEQVTLAALETMGSGAYGVIRISTHGSPWPNENDVQEVYIISGEEPSRLADALHYEELERGDLAPGAYAGGKRYFVAADYLASRVDFGDSEPLVLNGFCFSWLGDWPDLFRGTSKAGAVLGWDWEVVGSKAVAYDVSLLQALCDTNVADWKTLQAWHTEMAPSYPEYGPGGAVERTVTLHYTAADSFALWKLLKITSITPEPASPGSTVVIQGIGFGEEEGEVAFGFAPVTTIHSWSPASITADVPENAYIGENEVTVTTAGGERSGPYLFTVAEEEQENLWPSIYGAASLYLTVYGAHRYDETPSVSPFAPILNPPVWDGSNFTGGVDQRQGTEEQYDAHHETFQGSLAPDGRTMDLMYTRADTSAGSWWLQTRYERIELTGLPFSGLAGDIVEYRVEGANVETHVDRLEFHEYNWTEAGGVTLDNHYLSTDWNSTENPPSIIAYFW